MKKMVSGCGEDSSNVSKDNFFWLFEARHFFPFEDNGISALQKQPLPLPVIPLPTGLT